MDSDTTPTANSMRLKRDLGREAVNLALKGEWERATEVNKAILELFTEDVEAMNRMAKAFIEMGHYADAKAVLDRVCEVAPYNNIAKKNRARLGQMSASPTAIKQKRKATGAPQLFIEESGKSATTVLRKVPGRPVVSHVSPGDPVTLERENNAMNVYYGDGEGEFIGQVEPKMGKRLIQLIEGGNTYAAAIIVVNDQGISVIIRETFRHRSLQNVCSFPTKSKNDNRAYMNESVARFMRDDEPEEDDDEENVIDEEALENDWAENE
jgi:hypothetical protein